MVLPPLRRTAIVIAVALAAVATLGLPWVISSAWLWARLPEQWSTRTVIVIAIDVALVFAVAIWWLWWRLPKHQVRELENQIPDPKARVDVEDDFRKTIGQALGGTAVLIGAGFAYLQFSAQQQATRDQLQSAHDLLISNQVSKGFEQLANKDSVVMRLGGIYSLEGVMNTSEQYHQPVLEALCAFVRDSTIGRAVSEQRPVTDVQAALRVIGRRKEGAGDVNLNGAYIPKADLQRANLQHADLGNAKLSRAFLSQANLSGAGLVYSDLSGANLNSVNLSGAILWGADLRDAYLWNTDLSGASLRSNLVYGDARNLTQQQLDEACGKPASLPLSLHLDKPCLNGKPVAPPLNQKATP